VKRFILLILISVLPVQLSARAQEINTHQDDKSRPRYIESSAATSDQPVLAKDASNILGRIYNPESGKTYKCTLTLLDDNTLKLRGYKGISLLGGTEVWTRRR